VPAEPSPHAVSDTRNVQSSATEIKTTEEKTKVAHHATKTETPNDGNCYNLRGGPFQVGGAYPLTTSFGDICTATNSFNIGYSPKWVLEVSLAASFVISMILAVCGLPFSVLLFFIIPYLILCTTALRKVSFDLNEEVVLFDEKRKLIALKLLQKGKPVSLGFSVKGDGFDSLISLLPKTEATSIKKSSRLKYFLLLCLFAVVLNMLGNAIANNT